MINYSYAMPTLSENHINPNTTIEENLLIKESLESFKDIYNSAAKDLSENNYSNYSLSMTKICLLRSLYIYELYEDHKEESNVDHALYKSYKKQADTLFQKIDLHQEDYYFLVKDGVYENPKDYINDYPGVVLRALTYYEFYEKGIPPLSSQSADSSSSILHIFENILPYFIIFIVLLSY